MESVLDGDTIRARVTIWIDQEILVAVRVAGVDAPERRGANCPAEREQAEKARAFTLRFFADNRAMLRDIRYDKYGGRVVARIENAAGEDLAAALRKAGFAVDFGAAAWCAPPRS
ncbi:MAG: thermonuclease family protein [Amphiplicatus sp.]